MRVDDSVVRTFEGRERVLRRSRGYVPHPIDLGIDAGIAGRGAELKNTFCLTKDRYAILSQHIGDLENYETMQFFEETLSRIKHLFQSRTSCDCLRFASQLHEYPDGPGVGNRI